MRGVVVHTRLSAADVEALDKLATERRASRSSLIREMVRQGLDVPAPALPDKSELLALLGERARAGSITAIELLLKRTSPVATRPTVDAFAGVDEVAAARRKRRRDAH
jgi:Ribbon-helix-helix protein, copG family